jgi:hypothetical protein
LSIIGKHGHYCLTIQRSIKYATKQRQKAKEGKRYAYWHNSDNDKWNYLITQRLETYLSFWSERKAGSPPIE